MKDIAINKIQSIQRCIERAREEYYANPAGFPEDYTRQDAALLNVLRACEQTIDLANHIIKSDKMGIPASSGESFELLEQKGVIDSSLAEKLKKMVHFRNTVVHHYQEIDMEIVRSVLITGLDDLLAFADQVMEREAGASSLSSDTIPPTA